MKYRILAITATAAILTLFTAANTFAQDSDYPEEDGAYLEDINGYNGYQNQPSNQQPYQQPYSQNSGDPCATAYYANSPQCQNRSPYGQQPMNNPYGQYQHVQPQNPNNGYGQQNPFRQNQSPQIPGAQTVQIMDRQNPSGRPIVAKTRKIPAGWQASGGINWRQNNNPYCGLLTPHISWSAQSPDRKSGIEVWPEEKFSGSASPNMGGALRNCPNTDISNNRTFVSAFIQKKRPGARITNIKEPSRAELAQLQTALSPLPSSGDPDLRQRVEINAATVNLTYTANGQSYDEVAFVGWITIHSSLPSMMGMPGTQSHYTITMPTFAMRAPSGQLNQALAAALYETAVPNPVHEQMTRKYHEQQMRQNSKRMIAESKARMRNNRMPSGGSVGSSNPVGDIIANGGPESGRNPNGQSNTINAIRGVNVYNDPYSATGTVEGTNGQRQMYRRDDGTYVQTNDPFYNQGTQLEPKE
jgi:hypothetical protein